jgi:hypothetical protein
MVSTDLTAAMRSGSSFLTMMASTTDINKPVDQVYDIADFQRDSLSALLARRTLHRPFR